MTWCVCFSFFFPDTGKERRIAMISVEVGRAGRHNMACLFAVRLQKRDNATRGDPEVCSECAF